MVTNIEDIRNQWKKDILNNIHRYLSDVGESEQDSYIGSEVALVYEYHKEEPLLPPDMIVKYLEEGLSEWEEHALGEVIWSPYGHLAYPENYSYANIDDPNEEQRDYALYALSTVHADIHLLSTRDMTSYVPLLVVRALMQTCRPGSKCKSRVLKFLEYAALVANRDPPPDPDGWAMPVSRLCFHILCAVSDPKKVQEYQVEYQYEQGTDIDSDIRNDLEVLSEYDCSDLYAEDIQHDIQRMREGLSPVSRFKRLDSPTEPTPSGIFAIRPMGRIATCLRSVIRRLKGGQANP